MSITALMKPFCIGGSAPNPRRDVARHLLVRELTDAVVLSVYPTSALELPPRPLRLSRLDRRVLIRKRRPARAEVTDYAATHAAHNLLVSGMRARLEIDEKAKLLCGSLLSAGFDALAAWNIDR